MDYDGEKVFNSVLRDIQKRMKHAALLSRTLNLLNKIENWNGHKEITETFGETSRG